MKKEVVNNMVNILENEQYQIARYNFIRKQESYIPGLYFDSKGFLTTGTGYLLARVGRTRLQCAAC